ncbi:amidohydrolase [Kocuria tytonicola]|uniref:M20 family metallopeptidase n=1 Tax=Kocuria tytonicola TaxID=2055946 RepID=UPI000EF92934|nr:M20 family metallopeptidase [Kocuria tytonicola]RLZ03402.1 amidohydrolase [Kocuria tytonicola]
MASNDAQSTPTDEPTAPCREVPHPSRAYLHQLQRDTDRRKQQLKHHLADHDGAPHDLQQRLEQLVDEQAEDLRRILHELHDDPETAFQERRAARRIVSHLDRHGIPAQSPIFGLDTAIRAEVASSDFDPRQHRTIAVMSEYDALPGIGHGCGHNVIAVTGLGAFVALARLLREDTSAFSGRVVYLGTPAEEGEGGKEIMARAGALDGVDAAAMVHPYVSDLVDQVWLGRRQCEVTFRGIASHASSHPFMGRNALDAAVLAYQGLGLLRQQTPPTDRIHAVLPEGGQRPNIITEQATLRLYVRSQQPDTLKVLSSRVDEIMEGAALMAGVGVEVAWDSSPATLPVLGNGPLSDRWVLAQRRRGRDPYPAGTVSEVLAASTDFGNVSYRIPGIHPLIGIATEDTGLHSREFAAAAATPRAEQAGVDGAYGLAAVALDYLRDDVLAQNVAKDFRAGGGGISVPDYFE